MRIVAVIPARAGSKGIPNKNVRLINGRPLIWYTICTAKKSKYITDVIVSTDSDEVQVIAEQMGVNVKRRDAKLCEDDVTLDAVIYDAVKDKEWDYVVTMQPTSPTLQTDTLDCAIIYCIQQNLDTVISVINAPHLSWREENGKKIPNYEKRLNRQYLPPNYLETGAFVISNAACVTETSRIGVKVDVYEVSENEAIDIDSFQDLQYVESILQSQKVAIYVNGNRKIGMGHIYRALELADEFYCKPDIYYDVNQTDRAIFGQTTHNLIGVDGVVGLYKNCELKQYDIFINDILTTDIAYMSELRKAIPNAKIINFEDDGEGTYKADLVINALYHESELPHIKVGKDYYLAPKLFLFYDAISIKENVQRILITFGGADPQNYTDRLLNIITQDKYKNLQFVVVLGRAKNNVDELMGFNKYQNIEVLYDIKNMPQIMSSCDLAVTSRGRTGYELAMMGIPTIALAQNKREEKHTFICSENGFSYLGMNPGDHVIEANLDMYISMSAKDRFCYQELLLKNNLKNGRKRIMNLIKSL